MHTETVPPATAPRPWSRARRGRGVLAGLLACGAALGVAELLAGVVGAQASPVVAVGGAAIDATPQWLKEFAIRAFGERDKLVLLAGIAAVLAGFAAAAGLVAVRRLPPGLAGVALSAPPARPPPSPGPPPARSPPSRRWSAPPPSRPWFAAPGPGRPRPRPPGPGRPPATRLRARAPGGGAYPTGTWIAPRCPQGSGWTVGGFW
jgi:hypothetical protein